MAAQTAGRTAPHDVGVRAQSVQERLRDWQRIADQMARGVSAAAVDALANIGLSFLAKAFELGNFAFLAGLFELLDGFKAELIVHGFDFLWPESGNIEHSDQPRRRGG